MAYFQIVLVRKNVGLVTQNAQSDAKKIKGCGHFSFLLLLSRGFYSTSKALLEGFGQSIHFLWELSTLGLPEEAADPANQSLDEGVAGAYLAVQTLHLQQLPLKSLPESSSHVALQLRAHTRQEDR